ncbi:hypothetical protein GUJ93_ZPchr0005g16293 [Zizania palustris]|uniref:Uncharacterized protein n=1 Tax=Zizania palustris TaxID=103762 RepID=A0A8J5W0J3_ZIZPA|nr:hypothetical protein GUJ93_ZPchr0005g16293 [Zizania palustris]
MSFLRLLSQRLPQLVRQVEQDVETVINVLQPGPIGIVEHKFTDAEIRNAQAAGRNALIPLRLVSGLGMVFGCYFTLKFSNAKLL